MNDIASTLYSFLPIIIGIVLLLGMKSINLTKNKIQVQMPDVRKLIPEDLTEITFNTGIKWDVNSVVTEYLIINGKLPQNKEINLIPDAIHATGIATYSTLSYVKEPTNHPAPDKMTLIIKDAGFLPPLFAKCDPVSGLLIAYSLNEGLEIVSQWT